MQQTNKEPIKNGRDFFTEPILYLQWFTIYVYSLLKCALSTKDKVNSFIISQCCYSFSNDTKCRLQKFPLESQMIVMK